MVDNEIFSVKKVGDLFEITRGEIITVSKDKVEDVCETLERNMDTLKAGLKDIKDNDASKMLEDKLKSEKKGFEDSLARHIKDKEEFELKISEKRYDEIIAPLLKSENDVIAGIKLAIDTFEERTVLLKEKTLLSLEAKRKLWEEQLESDEKLYRKYTKLLL